MLSLQQRLMNMTFEEMAGGLAGITMDRWVGGCVGGWVFWGVVLGGWSGVGSDVLHSGTRS